MHKELALLEEKLVNVSDVDLYRIYRERWANPDRQRPNHTTLRPDAIDTSHNNVRAAQNKLYSTYGHVRSNRHQKAVEEYNRDHDMLELERLIQYMLNPEEQMLSEEAVFEALFPQLGPNDIHEWEIFKFKSKVDELHPYVFSVWDNVRTFYAKDQAFDRIYDLEEEPEGGMPYLDPVKAYKYNHDPLHVFLRSAYAQTGNILNKYNRQMQTDQEITKLYDHDELLHLDHMQKEYDMFKPPPANQFIHYVKHELNQALDEKQQELVKYWNTLYQPFVYQAHPRGASNRVSPEEHERAITVARPVFLELPDLQFIEISDHSINTPKYNSKVVFDYVAYDKTNPGKVIDSSYRIGEPIKSFWGTDLLPKCLTMTLKLVPEGSRVHVTCPPRFLFGENGWPERGYPANKEIMFDIIMREVTKPLPSNSWLISADDTGLNESQY